MHSALNPARRQLVYKDNHAIAEGTVYEVEVVFNAKQDLVITASSNHGPEQFVIDIEADRVKQLMDIFGGDYHQLCSNLKLMNDRMVLVNPKFEAKWYLNQ